MKYGHICLKIFVLLAISVIALNAVAGSSLITITNISDNATEPVYAGETILVDFTVLNSDDGTVYDVTVDPGNSDVQMPPGSVDIRPVRHMSSPAVILSNPATSINDLPTFCSTVPQPSVTVAAMAAM